MIYLHYKILPVKLTRLCVTISAYKRNIEIVVFSLVVSTAPLVTDWPLVIRTIRAVSNYSFCALLSPLNKHLICQIDNLNCQREWKETHTGTHRNQFACLAQKWFFSQMMMSLTVLLLLRTFYSHSRSEWEHSMNEVSTLKARSKR